MRRTLSWVLLVLGALFLALSIPAGYVNRTVLDAPTLASNVDELRQRPDVSAVLGRELATTIIEQNPNLVAIAPLVDQISTAVVAGDALSGPTKLAASQFNRALMENNSSQFVLRLADAGAVVSGVVAVVAPDRVVYWQVPTQVLQPYVADAYVAADIGGSGLVVVNPQLYTSIFNNGQELTTETEFNIVVAPKSAGSRAPHGLALADYLAGNDHTKLLGNLRMHVACDDKVAVQAGRAVFGEPKFVTSFSTTCRRSTLPTSTCGRGSATTPSTPSSSSSTCRSPSCVVPARRSTRRPSPATPISTVDRWARVGVRSAHRRSTTCRHPAMS